MDEVSKKIHSQILVVTGYSGAGKTTFLKILEDRGYFCIDNFPVQLLKHLIELVEKARAEELEKVAIVIDVRNERHLGEFPSIYRRLKRDGVNIKIVFLKASPEILKIRYKRTRRPHPFSHEGLSLEESISKEIDFLKPIYDISDYIIDTANKTPSQLAQEISKITESLGDTPFFINILSFGYVYGIPEDSDIVIDLRFLPNPYYIDTLKNKTGKSKAVRDFLFHLQETDLFLKRAQDFLSYIVEKYIKERSYLTIAFGCTGGRHRSVAIAEYFGRFFKKKGYNISVIHRDIKKRL